MHEVDQHRCVSFAIYMITCASQVTRMLRFKSAFSRSLCNTLVDLFEHVSFRGSVAAADSPKRAHALLQAIAAQCLARIAPLSGTRAAAGRSPVAEVCLMHPILAIRSKIVNFFAGQSTTQCAALLESLELALPCAEWASAQLDALVRFILQALRGHAVPEPIHIDTSASLGSAAARAGANCCFVECAATPRRESHMASHRSHRARA